MQFRSPYIWFDRDDAIVNLEPSMTEQSHKDSCDINVILDRFAKTGVANGNSRMPQFLDTCDLPSYQESLNVIIDADEAFMSLDSKLRKRFDNDPAKLLEFVDNPSNLDECIELGLIAKPLPKAEFQPKEKAETSEAGEAKQA